MRLLAFLLAFLNLHLQQNPQTPAPADPNQQLYQNLLLGMKFTYPKAWEVTTNKKTMESRILIPIENTSDRAVVEILPINFRKERDIWQLTELAFNKSKKRDVERQWEEEILGVPLLLTKVSYSENGSLRTAETGLVYSLGFHKLMYRLTSSPSEFDKADYAWRQVLLSLRTWDGEMPQAEDQRKIEIKPAPSKMIDEVPHPTVPHELPGPKSVKPVKAPVAESFQIGDQKLELHIPADWKGEGGKDGVFTLHHAGVSNPVTVAVFATAGADPASIALAKAAGTSLADFTAVARRDESLPLPNRAGSAVAQVWRSGKGSKGDLFTCQATGETGDYYFLLTYRAEDAAKWIGDRREIESLLMHMSVEKAP